MYCSEECQRDNWEFHKLICGKTDPDLAQLLVELVGAAIRTRELAPVRAFIQHLSCDLRVDPINGWMVVHSLAFLVQNFELEEYSIMLKKVEEQKIGIEINRETLFIGKLSGGLMQEWNESHPETQVRIGDSMMSINDQTDPDELMAEFGKSGDLRITLRRRSALSELGSELEALFQDALDFSVDINASTKEGETVLHMLLCKECVFGASVVRWLLTNAPINVTKRNAAGLRAEDLCEEQAILQLFAERSADVERVSQDDVNHRREVAARTAEKEAEKAQKWTERLDGSVAAPSVNVTT